MTDLTVARTIHAQLGGHRFAVMTGARGFVGTADSLSFKLPSRFAKDGINAVRIVLTPGDLYDLAFKRVRGAKVADVETRTDIHVEDLQKTFTAVTGLDTRI